MQRRSFLKNIAAAMAATAVVPHVSMAADAKPKGPNEFSLKEAVAAITGGKPLQTSPKIKLKAPEIAENGAVVPVKVDVDSAMTDAEHVQAIYVLATKNNNVRCAYVHLTPANGQATFGTRVKLGGTQDVLAIAKMSDGSFISASQNVKVTIGGCG
ncbi:MAG: sulfur oxidation protein SoxY [Sulfuricurvum sp. PC08-66]|nr:MAG: sulfur oxidation protein SoxY [Sulfuricurvum sp. PC08-66]